MILNLQSQVQAKAMASAPAPVPNESVSQVPPLQPIPEVPTTIPEVPLPIPQVPSTPTFPPPAPPVLPHQYVPTADVATAYLTVPTNVDYQETPPTDGHWQLVEETGMIRWRTNDPNLNAAMETPMEQDAGSGL